MMQFDYSISVLHVQIQVNGLLMALNMGELRRVYGMGSRALLHINKRNHYLNQAEKLRTPGLEQLS